MKVVCEVQDIKNILIEFQEVLPSLSSGRVDVDLFATKIHKNGFLCVFDEKEENKGFAAFYANNLQTYEAFLSMIAVKPKYQKEHIGSKILAFVEEMSIRKGMKFLRLEVRKKNDGAIIFYRKKGFSVYDQSEDSWFMQKRIGEFL